MDTISILKFMSLAEKLKCNLRHSWTSNLRQESVAEHSWRLCVFAWLLKNDFPGYNMDRVMMMCLFHDIGEAITGDIPAFYKTTEDEEKEFQVSRQIATMLDEELEDELTNILIEIEKQETKEAKLFKALDKLEGVMQHNETDLDTWLPLEYELNLTYGQEEAKIFSKLNELREKVREMSLELIETKRSIG